MISGLWFRIAPARPPAPPPPPRASLLQIFAGLG
jgi:hypothetical protein